MATSSSNTFNEKETKETNKTNYILDKKTNGGSFATYDNKGNGSITIGTKWRDNEYRFRLLLHEVMESILTADSKRYSNSMYSIDKENHLFSFSHEYLDTENFIAKIVDALKSVNAITINKIK